MRLGTLRESRIGTKIYNVRGLQTLWRSTTASYATKTKGSDLIRYAESLINIPKDEVAFRTMPSHKPIIIRKVDKPSNEPVDLGDTKAIRLEKEGFKIISEFNNLSNPIELKHKVQSAITILEEALNTDPHKLQLPNIYYGLGLCYMRLGDWLACEAMHKKAVDNDNDFVPAYEGIGEALMMQGQYPISLAWFTKFYDTFPEYYSAFGEYSKKLSSEDILANILFKRGVCYFKIQDYTCAAGDFNVVVALDKINVAASFNWLGKIALEKGKWWDAIALNTKAIEKKSKINISPL